MFALSPTHHTSSDITQLLRRSQYLQPQSLRSLPHSFLSRPDDHTHLSGCVREGLPGFLFQLHLPVHRRAVSHSDPVSGSLGHGVGVLRERQSPAHTKVRTLEHSPVHKTFPHP